MTLYVIPFWNKKLVKEKINMKNFVFCGKNWDFYFTEKIHKDAEKIENCRFTKRFHKEKTIDFDREQNIFLEEE